MQLLHLWNIISCIEPKQYKKRFQQKISNIIEHSIFIREITGSWSGKRELSEPKIMMNNNTMTNSNSLSDLSMNQSVNK